MTKYLIFRAIHINILLWGVEIESWAIHDNHIRESYKPLALGEQKAIRSILGISMTQVQEERISITEEDLYGNDSTITIYLVYNTIVPQSQSFTGMIVPVPVLAFFWKPSSAPSLPRHLHSFLHANGVPFKATWRQSISISSLSWLWLWLTPDTFTFRCVREFLEVEVIGVICYFTRSARDMWWFTNLCGRQGPPSPSPVSREGSR